jgi:hypothetical protein
VALDTSKAGEVIAEQMEALAADYDDSAEAFEIGAVVTIIEIAGPDGGSHLRIRNSMGNPTLTLGYLRLAEDELIRSMRME